MKISRFYYSEPKIRTEVLISSNGIEKVYGKLKRHKRVSICGILDTELNTLSFGATLCSEKDVFHKKIGRELSEKRALENPIMVTNVTKGNIGKTFINCAKMIEENIFGMKQYLL